MTSYVVGAQSECLGALDGTHIEVRVSDSDKGRYRNRKGQISVNVLGVWNYYLCDNGYRNVEGFLTLYHGVRYHLKEWDRGCGGPQTTRELFNLGHSSARNIIE
ncbi:UNVERIFIED_CONTAM: hypothetical protein Scaly_1499000 [Sesamum calycinum]|uniref:DDE Tnp4 domain-containing protein n=1 Tax=Sesamum calycinum TaxID=2727403 RepID=A0AAW2PSZ8_9LAMI